MPTTLELETPTVEIARGHSLRIDGDTEPRFYNDLEQSAVIRTIETDCFEVRFIAETPRDLDLSCLITKAHVDQGTLFIDESSRYSKATVEKHGADQVIEWINEDRRHMAEVIRSYTGLSDEVAVFDARVQVVHKDSEAVLGEDTLGGCIYDSFEDFCQGGGYASDMVAVAIEQARNTIHDMQDFLAPPSKKGA